MSSCRSKRHFGSIPNTSQKRMQWRRPLSLDVVASALLITRCADGSFAGNGSASGCTRIAPLCSYGSVISCQEIIEGVFSSLAIDINGQVKRLGRNTMYGDVEVGQHQCRQLVTRLMDDVVSLGS
jgi:hypothetical protein